MCLGEWGQLGVAGFIAITAYFTCEKNGFHTIKLVELIFETITMNLIAGLIVSYMHGTIALGSIASIIIGAVLSPFSGQYWFITPFLYLYLLLPMLQFVVSHINGNGLRALSLSLTIIVSLVDFLYLRSGGAFLDFVCLYLLTSYIKLYKNVWMNEKCHKIFFCCVGVILICTISLNVIINITGKTSLAGLQEHFFVNWNILIYLASISLLWIFKGISISRNKIINTIAASSFGIYLLSENAYMGGANSLLWIQVFHLNDLLNSKILGFYLLIDVAIVFGMCFLINYVYRGTIKRLIFNNKRFAQVFTKLDSKIQFQYK